MNFGRVVKVSWCWHWGLRNPKWSWSSASTNEKVFCVCGKPETRKEQTVRTQGMAVLRTSFSCPLPTLPHLRRPGYLGNVEESQQVCHRCGNARASCSHHSDSRRDMLWTIAELIKVQRINFVLGHKTQGGLQGFGNGVASVEYSVSQRHVGKKGRAAVYFLYGKYHSL